MRVFYESRLLKLLKFLWIMPKWVTGLTFGQWIFTRYSKSSAPERHISHEKIHTAQYKKHGIIPFLWIYFWKERHLSYRKKSFEVEAYANDHDPDYWKTVN